MQSMLTEPVGPRSPDEILAVVYDRTNRVRRRRRTRLTAGAAFAAVALTGLVATLAPSDKEARLHVVDNRKTGTEEAAAVRTTPAPSADGEPTASTSTTTTRPRKEPPPAAFGGTVTTQAPAPTTSTTLPRVQLLAEAVDAEGDASPNSWYFDIVHGSMALDSVRSDVVLKTRYRSPGAEADNARDNRTMRSEVTYDQAIYAIAVDETDGVLSDVKIDGRVCGSCGVTFSAADATLTVHVPLDEFNAAVAARRAQATPLSAQSQISDLKLVTERLLANLTTTPADSSANTGGAP